MILAGLRFGACLAVAAELRATALDRETPRTAAERRHLAESPDAFEAAVKKVARHKPVEEKEKSNDRSSDHRQ